MSSPAGTTPRQSIEAECRRRGRVAVVAGCVALLHGDDRDRQLILVLGGEPAQHLLSGACGADLQLWQRVWATRGLLWAWDESAVDVLRIALVDESWRVREMAAKVVARHRVGELIPLVAGMHEDPVARVRAAGERAMRRLVLSRA